MFATQLLAYAVDRCGLAPGQRLAVGTSGGVDSTVLLRALCVLGFEAVAVYVHHGLRAEADDEAAFVAAMAQEAGAEALVVRAPVGPGNRQGEARRARYAALADAARQSSCAVVAVGHTATDQAETVLMALVRGAGLRGLSGMAPRRRLGAALAGEKGGALSLVRPLLWATRAEVEAEARARGWAWRDDASNATDAYRRNRLRHHVLPLLDAEGGPATAARIAASADAARAALGASPAVAADGSVPLAALRAPAERSAALAEALRTFAPDAPRSRAVVARLVALVEAPAGRRVGLGGVTVWRDRDRLRFVRDAPAAPPAAVARDGVETAAGRLVRTPLDAVPETFPRTPFAEIVDASALVVPLVVRPWAAGDRLVPVGGGGERLVADLLTDARVPPSERAAALVLASGERVVWLVGLRLAAFAGVTAGTAAAERIEWRPAVGAVPGGG